MKLCLVLAVLSKVVFDVFMSGFFPVATYRNKDFMNRTFIRLTRNFMGLEKELQVYLHYNF